MQARAEHVRLEHGEDLDAAVATMSPEAFYEFYPYRLRASGPRAIKESWARLFRLPVLDLPTREVVSAETSFAESSMTDVVEITFVNENGERELTTFIGILHFDEEDRIKSEKVFFDERAMRYVDTVLNSAEFRGLPGIASF
jgi:hypothetical protein